MTRWEYATVEFVAAGFERSEMYDEYQATLNRFGGEGWELASAVTYHSPTAAADAVILFFKRPLAAG